MISQASLKQKDLSLHVVKSDIGQLHHAMRKDILVGSIYMDVSKNRDTPKWMVYKGEPY